MVSDSHRVLLLCLLLAGCNPWVDGWQATWAFDKCAARGGIEEFNTVIFVSVKCRDGSRWKPEPGASK